MLAGLLVLAPALPAAGAEPCFAGAGGLDDRRALAALRAETERTCPCATYAGPGRRGRRAYRQCARAVLADAPNVRPPCRRLAKAALFEATCGAPRSVACGRVHATSTRTEAGCRITPARRCRDRRGLDATACTAATHCADVTDWTAGTCVDARERGPWAAGVRAVRFTKDSVVHPGTPRDLDTLVWYPAAPGSTGTSAYGALLDVPLDPSGGPYPLVLFSHGSCGYPAQSTFLTPLLASHGFVVAAPPHPGNTLFDGVDCRAPLALASSFVERPNDVLHVLDALLAATADTGSPFAGAVDPTRVGMAGHSFGGLTTYLVAARDTRIRAVVPMAAAVITPTAGMTVPSLTLLGTIDGLVDNAKIREVHAASAPPRYLVELAATGHYGFSDLCFPSPDCAPPATTTQEEAHALVLRWVLPFLEVHLAGDARFRPFLDAAPPPGVAVSAAR